MILDDHPLLLDSSVWIRYLRPSGWDELKAAVREALEHGRVGNCQAVSTELLVGAKDEPAFDTLRGLLQALDEVPITATVWQDAARLGFRLRKQGLLVPLGDLLIAQCALSSDRLLWHADDHFEHIARLSPLRTRYWRAPG